MTEIASITKIPPIITNKNSFLVNTAIVPNSPPRDNDPTSPMKICAGLQLYHKKPTLAPNTAEHSTVSSEVPST